MVMPLRVLYQLCRELTDDGDLRTHTEQARSEKGCLEAECYRGFEQSEHIAILELWEDEYAYSEHWTRQLEHDMAFSTILRSSGVRRSGEDGAEFYRHRYFQTSEGVWTPPEAIGRQSRIDWPGGGQVRIISQNSRARIEETLPQLVAYSEETRKEPGCLQFEHFHSVEFEPHTMNLELWTDQVIYDAHWRLRQRSRASGASRASAGEGPRPPRQQGTNGFEFYQRAAFTHLYNRWLPVDVREWSDSVLWTM
jgi:quinol monooxygenase YgiN